MPNPLPDPNGRSSSAKRAAGPGSPLPGTGGTGEVRPADSKKSTSPHQPVAASLTDILQKAGSGRRPAGSDILQALGQAGTPPPDAGAAPDTDDAPTVITRPGGPPQPPPPTPLPVAGDPPSVAGRRLGNYELIEAVGAGGMAAVLKARDLELGRVVALKILPPESARDPESVTRFKQEARAAALLDHENVARVYACGEDQGLYFIAFEFVEGINLRQMIDRRGVIPAGECIRFMIQVAAGLAHAAQRGVVHRDIKPSNILITPDGRAKIVDMGLARQLDLGSVNGGVTQSGVTLGTFDYISPEQALDPRRADVRSDIYSLGCAFYHALTGRPPVPEGTAARKLRAHQETDPLDPRQINPHVPDELVLVLARMMAKDPTRRYQTPAELIAHLKGLAERLRLPDAVGQDSTVRAVPAELAVVPRPPRLRLGWVVGVAAVTVAVAVLAASGGGGPGRQVPPPWAGDAPTSKADPLGVLGPNGALPPNPVPDDGVVRTTEQFAAKLADPGAAAAVQLAPNAVIDLTTLADAVVFRGSSLELLGSAAAPATVRVFAGTADGSDPPRPGTLTVRKAAFAASGVRFEVVSAGGEAKAAEAGLVIVDAGKVELTDCVFAVAAPAGRSCGAVRLVRTTADSPVPQVRAERCLFARGGFAVWLPDQAGLAVADSGFGPHDAALRVGDPADVPGARNVAVTLDRSSFLLEPTSAVVEEPDREGTEPTVRVTAGFCAFGPVGGPPAAVPLFPATAATRRAVVVRAKGAPGEVRFQGDAGRKNVYYRVPALGAVGDAGPAYFTFDQCKADGYPLADAGGVQLAQRPWADRDPLRTLAGKEPWPAFKLNLADPAVFTGTSEKVLGAQFYNSNVGLRPWRAYPDLPGQFPPPPKTSPTDPRTLVWQPDAKPPLPPDTYDDLGVLLKNVRPGDVVLIRHTGELRLDATVELKPRLGVEKEFRVTFRAAEGFRPVLLAPGGEKLDQSLFVLMTGEVAFEGIHFLLKPARPRDGQTVSAVTVVGGRACSFADCVFTLAEEDDAKAAAVHVVDPKRVMAMDGGAKATPDVRFRRCVVRGKGRAVWVPASRPVRVDVEQCLTALDGPVFRAEADGDPGSARSALRLNRTTVFAGGPVVELRGAKAAGAAGGGLVPLDVRADESLFVAVPGAGRPLVELDAVDPAEVKSVFSWEVQDANRYANFDKDALVMVVRPADNTTPKELSWDQWIAFAREPGGRPVGRVTFEAAPTALEKLAAVKPADAAVKAVDFPDLTGAKPADAGATDRLPNPGGEP